MHGTRDRHRGVGARAQIDRAGEAAARQHGGERRKAGAGEAGIPGRAGVAKAVTLIQCETALLLSRRRAALEDAACSERERTLRGRHAEAASIAAEGAAGHGHRGARHIHRRSAADDDVAGIGGEADLAARDDGVGDGVALGRARDAGHGTGTQDHTAAAGNRTTIPGRERDGAGWQIDAAILLNIAAGQDGECRARTGGRQREIAGTRWIDDHGTRGSDRLGGACGAHQCGGGQRHRHGVAVDLQRPRALPYDVSGSLQIDRTEAAHDLGAGTERDLPGARLVIDGACDDLQRSGTGAVGGQQRGA